MKTVLFLMTAFIASLTNQANVWEPEPHTPLSKVEIPVGEQPYFALTIKGINATMVRTSEKAIRVELFAEASTDKSPVSKEAFFKKYTFDVNQNNHSIQAQLDVKPGANTPVNLKKWLVIYLPRTQRFHLETAQKMYFGAGFPDLHGSYSGTADFGPDDSVPNTRGHYNPESEIGPEGNKTDAGGSKGSKK